jgi:hypothetical protein
MCWEIAKGAANEDQFSNVFIKQLPTESYLNANSRGL